MREIGRRLKAKQNLTSDDIAWLVAIAKAVLRAFVWDEGQPMRTLADALGISPTTLYTTLRLAVQALMLVRRGKRSVEGLVGRARELQDRLAQVGQAYRHGGRRLTIRIHVARSRHIIHVELSRLL